ncbi:hypothetical protein HOD38_01390 [archaeon]|nr:hypothetical protein [archaeon]MBT4396898.1 hypothetical protein [archaeon]MBT4441424.1 hypothetical protein [archaeon]
MLNNIIFEHRPTFSTKQRIRLAKVLAECPIEITSVGGGLPDILLREGPNRDSARGRRAFQNYELYPLGLQECEVSIVEPNEFGDDIELSQNVIGFYFALERRPRLYHFYVK